jgi:hypothetical protein
MVAFLDFEAGQPDGTQYRSQLGWFIHPQWASTILLIFRLI